MATVNLEQLLLDARQRDGAAVLIAAGDAPQMWFHGQWIKMAYPPCTPTEVEGLVTQLLSAAEREELKRTNALELERRFGRAGGAYCHVLSRAGRLSIELRLLGAGAM